MNWRDHENLIKLPHLKNNKFLQVHIEAKRDKKLLDQEYKLTEAKRKEELLLEQAKITIKEVEGPGT